MARRTGTLLRLIDVVFILLFGFLAISEINRTGVFQLPKKSEVETDDPIPTSLLIEITQDGKFFCGEGKLEFDGEAVLVNDTVFQGYLQDEYNNREDKKGFYVEILSDKRAAIQHAITVKDACDKLGFLSLIEVTIEE
jgi:biopolymer transport protein ExbD